MTLTGLLIVRAPRWLLAYVPAGVLFFVLAPALSAIPALIGYRYYRNRVDTLVVDMEKEAIKLVEAESGFEALRCLPRDEFDLVVLSVGLQIPTATREMAERLGQSLARTEEYQALKRAIEGSGDDRELVELQNQIQALEELLLLVWR